MNLSEVQATANSARREEILNELLMINDLPTLPTVFLKVMSMLRNSNIPLKEIANTVEADPAICVKLLRLINSSFYGMAKRIDSVQQATVLLGSNTLRNVIITVSIFKSLDEEITNSNFDRAAFWRHSIACGMVGRLLARELTQIDPEECFIGGIIHDIGKIVLDRYFHSDFEVVVKAVAEEEISFYHAERRLLGVTHTEIGAFLSELWNLPDHLIAAVAQHHIIDPESEYAKLASIIHLADITTRRFNFGSGGDNLILEPELVVWEILGITEEKLSEMDEEMEAEIEKSKEMLEALNE